MSVQERACVPSVGVGAAYLHHFRRVGLDVFRVVDFMPALSIAVSQYLRSKEGPDVVHDHEEIP